MVSQDFRSAVDRYTSIVVVIAAVANVLKFALARDAAALYTVAVIGSVSFIALAIYMRYFATSVTQVIKGLKAG
jgi:hypothetical protein